MSTGSAALCDLGRITVCDDSTTTTVECLAAIASTFFHTVALVRALGACATREHMLLHYDFCAAAGEHDSLPLYVCSVDDDTLAYRVAKALKRVRHAVQNKPGSECRLQLQVDLGVAPRAQRKRVEVQRNVRRAQRLEQLWREYRAAEDNMDEAAPSASALLPSPASPPSAACHSSSSASWWTWMRRTVHKKSAPSSYSPSSSPSSASLSAAVARAVAETDTTHDASILEESTLATADRSMSCQSASSFSRSSWEAAVGMAESAAAARLLGDDAAPTAAASAPRAAITLMPQEHERVRQLVMNELELRATEDDELCDYVWEQWRLEIVVCRAGAAWKTKREQARRTASDCRQLMLKITERCVEQAQALPPLTTSTWVTCWPLRLGVRASTCEQPPHDEQREGSHTTSALASTLWSMDDDFSHDDSTRSGSGVHAWSSLHTSACSPPTSTSAFNLGCEFLREFISAPSKTAGL